MKNTKQHYTQLIKNKAKELGFFYCGISKAEFLEDQAPRLESWLNKNHQGKMDYMQRNFDKRLDPRLLVDGAKSVVSLLLNYYTSEKQIDPSAPKISKYALGKDYHLVIKEKLGKLFEYLSIEIGEIGGRVFVDSAPVMDKVWAEKAGLGWIGKNSNLINPKEGSFFLLLN